MHMDGHSSPLLTNGSLKGITSRLLPALHAEKYLRILLKQYKQTNAYGKKLHLYSNSSVKEEPGLLGINHSVK